MPSRFCLAGCAFIVLLGVARQLQGCGPDDSGGGDSGGHEPAGTAAGGGGGGGGSTTEPQPDPEATTKPKPGAKSAETPPAWPPGNHDMGSERHQALCSSFVLGASILGSERHQTLSYLATAVLGMHLQ